MTARAVLVDERDRQLGTITVNPACFIIKHGDAHFVRTGKMARLRGNRSEERRVGKECRDTWWPDD